MKKQDLKTMQVSDYVSSAHPTAVNRKEFGLRVTFAVKYQYWTELVNLLLDRICVYRRAYVRPRYLVASRQEGLLFTISLQCLAESESIALFDISD